MSDSRRTGSRGKLRAWWLLPLVASAPLLLLNVAAQEPQTPKRRVYDVTELRNQYPFVSIEPRLEYERKRVEAEKDRPAPKLSQDAEKMLQLADARSSKSRVLYAVRSESLRLLHSEQAAAFVKRDGFGLSRLPIPSPGELEFPVPKALVFDTPPTSSAQDEQVVVLPKTDPVKRMEDRLRMPPLDVLRGYLEENQLYFASPASLGHIIDRKHVAGFVPHAFSHSQDWIYPIPRSPEEVKTLKSDKWVMASLELVSLLKHERPVTYVSDHLPKMDELKDAKTRPLSEFEAKSLKSLFEGEDVVAVATTNRILMLGALRASKSCQECHYVQRGELLGAFSYDLRRSPPLKVERLPNS